MLITALIVVFCLGYLATYNWLLFLAVLGSSKLKNTWPMCLFVALCLSFLFYFFT